MPEFQIVPDQSFKCCNAGKIKNMKLTVKVTDVSNCISAGSEICIVDVKIDAGGAKEIGSIIFEPGGDSICVAENTNFTVYLLNTDTCTVNLLVGYQIGGTGPVRYTPIKSDNVAGGNLSDGTPGACEPAN